MLIQMGVSHLPDGPGAAPDKFVPVRPPVVSPELDDVIKDVSHGPLQHLRRPQLVG